jgi:hypothetical protein
MRRRNQINSDPQGSSEELQERRSSQEYYGSNTLSEKSGSKEADDEDKGRGINKLTLLDSVFLLGLKDSQVYYYTI